MSLTYSRAACQASQRQNIRSYDGKIIGYLDGDTFVKPLCGSKHQLKRPPAWAVDAEAFDEQIKPYASTFRIEDKETDTVYEVPVAFFDQHKGFLDRGYGPQYFLVLSKWEIVKQNGNGCKQLSLWDTSDNRVQNAVGVGVV